MATKPLRPEKTVLPASYRDFFGAHIDEFAAKRRVLRVGQPLPKDSEKGAPKPR